jgi:uncharacterized membrane protein
MFHPLFYQLCNALLIPKQIARTCPALNKQKINLEAMPKQLVCIRNIDEQPHMPNILRCFQATSLLLLISVPLKIIYYIIDLVVLTDCLSHAQNCLAQGVEITVSTTSWC